jgi:hypothetical protein
MLHQDQDTAGNGFFLSPPSILHLFRPLLFARWKVMLGHHLAGMKGVISGRTKVEFKILVESHGGTSVFPA